MALEEFTGCLLSPWFPGANQGGTLNFSQDIDQQKNGENGTLSEGFSTFHEPSGDFNAAEYK